MPTAAQTASPLAAPSDLEILAGNRTIEIRDRFGKAHALRPLTLYDMVEMERKFGSLDRLGTGQRIKLEDKMFILWLSLRKEGLTDADVLKGKYACTVNEAAGLFDAGKLESLVDLLDNLFLLSGFVPRKEDSQPDPMTAPGVETAAPAPSPAVLPAPLS